jgi:hypothetical protein
LTAGPADGDWVSGPHCPRVLGLEGLATAIIEPPALRELLADASAVVIDLDTSRRYAQGHIERGLEQGAGEQSLDTADVAELAPRCRLAGGLSAHLPHVAVLRWRTTARHPRRA